MSAQRKTSGARWSARSTVAAVDAQGQKVAIDDPNAAKVVVRWRHDGKSRKQWFSGATADADAAEFRGLLLVAAGNDWPADASGRPVVPGETGDGVPPSPAHVIQLVERTSVPAALAVPCAGMNSEIRNLEQLAAWYIGLQKSTKKKRGGEQRSPKTVEGYENEVAFLLSIARYPHGDPRLEASGCAAGDSLRVDDAAVGINEFDLVDLVALRESTNLRTRMANEKAMTRWAAAVEKEHRAATKQGRAPAVLDPPSLAPEMVEARTIESPARTARAVFTPSRHSGPVASQQCASPEWGPST